MFNRKSDGGVATMEPSLPSAQVDDNGRRETIIIADDDSGVRRALSAALRRIGYRVLEACSGAQAVQIAETEPGRVDMVLADVVMPSMTTDQLQRRLNEARPEARIAFMSGYIHDDLVRRSVLQSPVAFFEKPFTVPTLAKQIREVLDSRRN
jgi:DNA-binding NtrC family response regulator